MIPRRRLPLDGRDLRSCLRTLFTGDGDAAVVVEFERDFAAYHDVAYAHACASGRDSILLSLAALGFTKGDEILVPAYTLGELMPLIAASGVRPVPVDIEETSFNMDVSQIEPKIGPRTRGILATHLCGAPCDIAAICALARAHDLKVVEDCAHAAGAGIDGARVGTFGDIGVFSLETNKGIPTYGGGVIVTDDREIDAWIRSALSDRPRSVGRVVKKTVTSWVEELIIRSPCYGPLARVLFSERLAGRFEQLYRGAHDHQRPAAAAYTAFQAEIGRRRLAELDARNARCNDLWDAMAQRLSGAYQPQRRDWTGRPAFYNFVALSRVNPRVLRAAAARKGIDVGIGSEVMDDCGTLLGVDDCPVAASVASRAVMLPLYDELSPNRFERVVHVMNAVAA